MVILVMCAKKKATDRSVTAQHGHGAHAARGRRKYDAATGRIAPVAVTPSSPPPAPATTPLRLRIRGQLTDEDQAVTRRTLLEAHRTLR